MQVIQCTLASIETIHLRTYTTTYVPLHVGWEFNKHSLVPMEWAGYLTPDGVASGFAARIIDSKTGYTNITAGVIAGMTFDMNQHFPPFAYRHDMITGFTGFETLTPGLGEFYAPVGGGDRVYPNLSLRPGPRLPNNVANTQFPSDNGGCNFLANGGIYATSDVDLILHNYSIDGANGFLHDESAYGLNFPANAKFQAMLPPPPLTTDAMNIMITDPTGGPPPYFGIYTDLGPEPFDPFSGFANYIDIFVVNPDQTTLDINALFHTAANTTRWIATLAGFLKIYRDTQTFNGITMNGYGILLSPDFTEYSILNFSPLDALAANWNSGAAEFDAAIDTSGGLFLRSLNSNNTIFLGTDLIPLTVLTLPVSLIPPVNIPITPGFNK